MNTGRSRTLPLLAFLLLATASPAIAQMRGDSVEIEPYGGYVFGGELAAGTSGAFSDDVDVDDHAAFGLRAGYFVNDMFGVEASFLHESTEVVSKGGLFFPDTRLGDLDLDTLEGSMVVQFGRRRFRPFLSLGFGATRLELERDGHTSDDTKFQVSFGGGFKLWFADQVGLRLDVRHHLTALDTNDNYDDDDCHRHCRDDSETLGTTEVSAGITFAF